MMAFFQGFNFDTLLSVISCITGIIALFVGGSAYKMCKINNNNVRSKKKFGDECYDYSITVGGDYCEGINDKSLDIIMKKMSYMTSESFSVALNGAYTTFQEKCDDNLHKIIDETKRIIEEQKINIAGYTKIDWIHIYFESAKNTSDTYMQEVWAMVLARELSIPNSFSYKTLETLKNMSSEEFKLFEDISTLNVHGAIFKGEYLKEHGFDWMNLQKLKEYGLISLDDSEITVIIHAGDTTNQILNNEYVILFSNETEDEIEYKLPCYLFTNVAKELMQIVVKITNETIAMDVAQELEKIVKNKKGVLSLHKINYFFDNGKRLKCNSTDLLKKASDTIEENGVTV